MSQEMELDMMNRDPNNLNDHIKVCFEEVIGEPDGAHSINCCWANSYWCFNCCKDCCYKLMTLFCGIPIAMCWGIQFAMITFVHVWKVTPCLKCYMIQCGCMQKFYGTCLSCALQPMCEAYSYLLSNIKVTTLSG